MFISYIQRYTVHFVTLLYCCLSHQVKMEDHLKEGLTPVYSFADRSVTIGARPEHYEVIAQVLPIALEVG